jgi:hypothetical protein
MRFLALRRVSFAPSDDPGTQNVRIVDQYGVSTDARSGIVNDPNRDDDLEYIVRLIGQVVTVSLQTVKLVAELSLLSIDQA